MVCTVSAICMQGKTSNKQSKCGSDKVDEAKKRWNTQPTSRYLMNWKGWLLKCEKFSNKKTLDDHRVMKEEFLLKQQSSYTTNKPQV